MTNAENNTVIVLLTVFTTCTRCCSNNSHFTYHITNLEIWIHLV